MTEHNPEPDEGYTGPATLHIDDRDVSARVRLLAVFEPFDGRMHWSGRVEANDELDRLLGGRAGAVGVRTPSGHAEGTVGEPDPWGRYRVSGTGAPPFALEPVPLED